jgi:hypothetical protein
MKSLALALFWPPTTGVANFFCQPLGNVPAPRCWLHHRRSHPKPQNAKTKDPHLLRQRPDLNELDVPEWAELALDKVECRKLLQRIAL